MIYNALVNLSQSLRGFWQFWSLGGFDLMVLVLPNSTQAGFFYEVDNEFAADRSNEDVAAARERKITYSEILMYALPTSTKVTEFNKLITQVLVSQQQISLVQRDDSKTAEAMILLADILNEHWQEFPLKIKVLLLYKLKVVRKSFWEYIVISPFDIFKVLKNRINYNIGFWHELKTYDETTKNNILDKVSRNLNSLKNAWNALAKARSMIFKNDGHLLEVNKENIVKFIHDIRVEIWENETLEAARQAREVVRSGRFKRQTLDEFKTSLLSDDEE
jgi:hypothetical protein